MERGDPIERRGAVIPDAPLLGQLGHRVQLVLDHAQVAVIDRVSGADASRRQAPRPNPPADSLGVPTQPIGNLSDSQHAEDGTPSPGPQTLSPSNIGDQQRPTTTNHVHVDTSADSVARCQPASTYRPLATRTKQGEAPEALAARAALTEDHATGAPSDASTAAWMSLARIGSSRSASTRTTAFSTQPGRRGRCRQVAACRRGPPLARTALNFLARRPNDPCSSWFDRTPIRSISEVESDANRTILQRPVDLGTDQIALRGRSCAGASDLDRRLAM